MIRGPARGVPDRSYGSPEGAVPGTRDRARDTAGRGGGPGRPDHARPPPLPYAPPNQEADATPEELYDMSAQAHGGLSDRLADRAVVWRRSFRHWRGTRPFWAGVLTLLGGFPIMYFPYANLTLGTMTIRMATTAGAGSLIIGVLLVVLGLTMWFQKHSRIFAGVAAILLALVSLVVSNFGGLVAGYALALVGGALAIAWAPGAPVPAAGTDGRQRVD